MRKNKLIFSIILFLFMAFPAFSEPVSSDTLEIPTSETMPLDESVDEAIQNSIKEVETPHVEDVVEMTPNANVELKQEVLNDTNNELNNVFKKFLAAMAGVVVCSLLIFVILTVLNKINNIQIGINTKDEKEDEPQNQKEEVALDDKNAALYTFFEKTK